jgi:hypothetical protein
LTEVLDIKSKLIKISDRIKKSTEDLKHHIKLHKNKNMSIKTNGDEFKNKNKW